MSRLHGIGEHAWYKVGLNVTEVWKCYLDLETALKKIAHNLKQVIDELRNIEVYADVATNNSVEEVVNVPEIINID